MKLEMCNKRLKVLFAVDDGGCGGNGVVGLTSIQRVFYDIKVSTYPNVI